MQLHPYLNFDGNCREAFEFYEKLLGGRIVAMFTHGESPAAEHSLPEAQHLIMHARLELDGAVLMASDSPIGRYEKPQGIWLSLHPKSVADGERIFAALAEGGSVVMPYGATFWAEAFGMVTDRFGIPWMLNVEKPMQG